MSQCLAKSKRSKEQCRKGATSGKDVCHMHGGRSTGPKTKVGKEGARRAVLKHGTYTKEMQAQNKEVRDLIRQSKDFLRSIKLKCSC